MSPTFQMGAPPGYGTTVLRNGKVLAEDSAAVSQSRSSIVRSSSSNRFTMVMSPAPEVGSDRSTRGDGADATFEFRIGSQRALERARSTIGCVPGAAHRESG